MKGNKGFLTIKGIGNESGLSRFEWEKEISVKEAENLLLLCEPTIIEKIRHIIHANDHLYFEVDEFLGENSIPFYIVFTKADKLKLSELNRNIQVYSKTMTKSNWESMPPYFVTSAVDTTGKDELLNFIDELNQQVATPS